MTESTSCGDVLDVGCSSADATEVRFFSSSTRCVLKVRARPAAEAVIEIANAADAHLPPAVVLIPDDCANGKA